MGQLLVVKRPIQKKLIFIREERFSQAMFHIIMIAKPSEQPIVEMSALEPSCCAFGIL